MIKIGNRPPPRTEANQPASEAGKATGLQGSPASVPSEKVAKGFRARLRRLQKEQQGGQVRSHSGHHTGSHTEARTENRTQDHSEDYSETHTSQGTNPQRQGVQKQATQQAEAKPQSATPDQRQATKPQTETETQAGAGAKPQTADTEATEATKESAHPTQSKSASEADRESTGASSRASTGEPRGTESLPSGSTKAGQGSQDTHSTRGTQGTGQEATQKASGQTSPQTSQSDASSPNRPDTLAGTATGSSDRASEASIARETRFGGADDADPTDAANAALGGAQATTQGAGATGAGVATAPAPTPTAASASSEQRAAVISAINQVSDRITAVAQSPTSGAASAVRLELREDLLPGTSLELQRGADGGLTLSFSTTAGVSAGLLRDHAQAMASFVADRTGVAITVRLNESGGQSQTLVGGDGARDSTTGTGGDGRNDGQSRERKETEEELAARTAESNQS